MIQSNMQTEYQKVLNLLNPWWQNPDFRFKVKDRKKYLEMILNKDNKMIATLVGARRVGKTSIMRSVINNILDNGISPKKILNLNGDTLELNSVGIRKTVLDYARSTRHDLSKTTIHVFIDEVQEIDNWQQDVKFLYDNSKVKFYLSGSSATLLSQKTSKLTGRFELIHVFPLDYSEYLNFNNLKSSESSDEIYLENYLKHGGYPENTGDYFPGYLQEIIDSTLYRDLLSLYKIRNPATLERILKLLADKITTPVSASKIAIDLKIDNQTASDYLKYLEAVFLIYPLSRSAGSNRISFNYPNKYYFNDTGILHELSIRPRLGHLAENAVFLHLYKKSQKSNKILFYADVSKQEYDFILDRDLYEVKYSHETEVENLSKYEIGYDDFTKFETPIIIGDSVTCKLVRDSSLALKAENLSKFLMR